MMLGSVFLDVAVIRHDRTILRDNVCFPAYGTLRNETKRNETELCEMVLCEMVLCETVLCETVTQAPMRLNFSRWRRNPEN